MIDISVFLDGLCENAWLNNDKFEAGQILELFSNELSSLQTYLLEETIFGAAIEQDEYLS
jgi:hypothetical protein